MALSTKKKLLNRLKKTSKRKKRLASKSRSENYDFIEPKGTNSPSFILEKDGEYYLTSLDPRHGEVSKAISILENRKI